MIKHLLSAALLGAVCFGAQAQKEVILEDQVIGVDLVEQVDVVQEEEQVDQVDVVEEQQFTISDASYDSEEERYSYDFGEALQDTLEGGKYNKDMTFTIGGMAPGGSYSIKLLQVDESYTHTNGRCIVSETAPYKITSATTGVVGESGTAQFTVRFNPKAVPVLQETNIILDDVLVKEQVKASREVIGVVGEVLCLPTGNYIDRFGMKNMTVEITYTPPCPTKFVEEGDGLLIKKTREISKDQQVFVLQELDGNTENEVEIIKEIKDKDLITVKEENNNEEEIVKDLVLVDEENNNEEVIRDFEVINIKDKDLITIKDENNNEEEVEVVKELELVNVDKELIVVDEENNNEEEVEVVKDVVTVDEENNNDEIIIDRDVLIGIDKNPCPKSQVYLLDLKGKSVAKLTKDDEVDTDTETSILDAQSATIVAYPNPVSDVLHFEGEGKLFTAQGALVGEGEDAIDVSSLTNGLYFLQTQYGMTKIIKE
ncbi:MAG: T9SS type A sorting domain-containing protein [Cytophagales bacterium]|nr:T9SS type A sorting domain-containing protein [Cytophagales bacterium]